MARDTAPRVGRYALGDKLGQGAQGSVFAATLEGPSGFRKRVAIKLTDGRDSGALMREGRMGAMIRHNNVVDVYEVGRADDGSWFMAMELVDGPSVLQLLRTGPLPGRALVEIASQAASGLGAAHKAGLIHRDVKPSNLLVSQDGQLKVSDLGIGIVGGDPTGGAGTRGYRAPEQIDGGPVDGRADLFALGVCLWEMATGTNPLLRATAHETAEATRNAAALSGTKGVEEALDAAAPGLSKIVRRCVQPLPELRYEDARSLRRELVRLKLRESEGLVEVLARYETTNDWEVVSLADPVEVEPPTEPDAAIPPEPEAMIGRYRELAALNRQLAEGARHITLKGLAGMGKTRLAQRAAHQHARRGESVIWAALHGESDVMEVLGQVARLVGLTLEAVELEALTEQLGRALEAKGRLLLVLDGLGPADAELATCLERCTEHAPDLTLLCTTPAPVELPDEVVLELGPLPLEDALDLLDQALPETAPRMKEATRRAVVKAVDQIPLGIRLAARSLADTSPDGVLGQLDRSRADGSALDQAITWATERLQPWARVALIQLSVFEGRFSLDDANAVLDLSSWPRAPWGIDVVQTLWRRSLLGLRERKDGPELYMLAPVRAQARRSLDAAGYARATRTAHARRMARLGDPQALARLAAPGGAQRFKELSGAFEDLLPAARFAVGSEQTELAVPLARAVAVVCRRIGPFALGLEVVRGTLSLQPRRADRAALRLDEAALLGRLQRRDEAETSLDDAETAAKGRPDLLALVSLARANHALGTEDVHTCEKMAKLAMRRARSAGEPSCVAGALRVLGVAKREKGDTDNAEPLFLRARAIYEGLGDDDGVAQIDQSLGLLYRGMGRIQEGIERHALAQRAHQRTGSRNGIAAALHAMGVARFTIQELDQAAADVRAALEHYRALGDANGEASCRGTLASILITRGELGKAEDELAAVATIQFDAGRWRQFVVVANNLANLYTIGGKLDEARTLYDEAIAICEERGLGRVVALPLGNLGVLQVESGAPESGLATLQDAISRARSARQMRIVYALQGEAARALVILDRLTEAGALLDRAEEGLRKVNDRVELSKTLATRARWHAGQGDRDAGFDALAESKALVADHPSDETTARHEEAREALSRRG